MNTQKTFTYQAIVISSTDAVEQHRESDMVLILKSQRDRMNLKNRVYGVSREAFVPPIIERNFENIEEAKNIERRYSMPLKFGDIIQFNDSDVNHGTRMIHSIRREKPIYQASSNDGGQLLRIGGCIEKKNPTLFWTPLEAVAIPLKEASRAEPDVWLHAWIKIEVFMKSSQDPVNIDMTFDHYADFDPVDQGRVSEAPWHRSSLESNFALWSADPNPAEEDYGIELEERKDVYVEENKWAEKITKQLGLFVGDRLILCKDLPQYDFIIPLVRPIACAKMDDEKTMIYPAAGEYFHFSAIWSGHHRAFLITEMVPVPLIRGHNVSQTGNLVVRISESKFRGLYMDQNETLGLIDDPYQHLTMFEFHPAGFKGLTWLVEVRAVRSTENRSVRYRIIKITTDDENMDRINAWSEFDSEKKNPMGKLTLGPILGVVVGRDTVLCPKYPNVYFRLPNHLVSNFPLGAGVRITGRRIEGAKSEIEITEAFLHPDLSIRKFVTNGDYPMFQVPLKPLRDHVQLAQSEHFGLVDMRGMDHPAPTRNESELGGPAPVFLAWVRESPRFQNARRACTTMEVFSMALATPIIPIMSNRSDSRLSNNSSTRGSPRGTPRGTPNGSTSGSNGSRASINSISTSRFIGPSIRRAPPPESRGQLSASSSTSTRSGQH